MVSWTVNRKWCKTSNRNIARVVVTIALISLLIISDPQLTLIVGLSLGGSYLTVFYLTRKINLAYSKVREKVMEHDFYQSMKLLELLKKLRLMT